MIAVRNGEARLWLAETGEPASPVLRHDGRVQAVCYSADGKLVATGSDDHTARLWRADTGEPVGAPMRHPGAVSIVTFFIEDANIIMTASKDGTARLWSTASGAPRSPPLEHGAEVNTINLNTGRHLALTGGTDRIARLWQADTGKRVREFREDNVITAVSLSARGDFVLTASAAGTASVWRTDNGVKLGSLQYGNKTYVNAAFSGDGKTIGFGRSEWYFVRSWNGQFFQLLEAGLWRGAGPEWISSAHDGTHWELQQISTKGFLKLPADQPLYAPLSGNPQALIGEWERRLSLTIDPEGRIVPKYSAPEAPAPVKGRPTNTGKATPTKQPLGER